MRNYLVTFANRKQLIVKSSLGLLHVKHNMMLSGNGNPVVDCEYITYKEKVKLAKELGQTIFPKSVTA